MNMPIKNLPFALFLIALVMSGIKPENDIQQDEGFIHEWDSDSVSEIGNIASDRRVVLLGESTHGTSEYYTIRAEISMELIKNHGFNFVVVEGDWTSAWKVNQYVKGLSGAPDSAEEALAHFTRWPQWMWNNEETLQLVRLMRQHNENLPMGERAGFYGMDVYSFWESVDELARRTQLLEQSAAQLTEDALDCMLRFNRNQQAYLRSVAQGGAHCGTEIGRAIRAVKELEKPDGISPDDWFYLVQNLRILRQGELHFRGMLYQGPHSWNERASHFKITLSRLLDFYGDGSSGIAWAHNTHIGDARATDMHNAGMVNIGQLARIRYGEENVLAIGFGTFGGSVKAGRQWESNMEKMTIPPAIQGSLEHYLNGKVPAHFWMNLMLPSAAEHFAGPVPHRAVGVVYTPENDAQNNYVNTVLPSRYDIFIFIRETNALRPLGGG